jgi:NDP-sugar pyrophosphorylase family protein
MTKNICAFIVAGGQGSRLGKIGKHTQKCMLELWGKPMLYYTVEALKNLGCSKIVIAVNHLKDQIIDYFSDGKSFGVNIEYVEGNFESTYDALYHSLEYLSSRIIYLHANVLFQNSLLENIIKLGEKYDKNVIVVIPNHSLRLKHAQVSIDESNYVSEIDLTKRNNKYPYTFLGIAYYKKQDSINQFDGDFSGMVEKIIWQLLEKGEKSIAFQYNGNWHHIETESDYLEMHNQNKDVIA